MAKRSIREIVEKRQNTATRNTRSPIYRVKLKDKSWLRRQRSRKICRT